jgi:alpha-tubulin suppressor-like RCC1 family protein
MGNFHSKKKKYDEELEPKILYDKNFQRCLKQKLCNKHISKILVGYEHCIFLMSNGDVYSAGNNENYQLGIPKEEIHTCLMKKLKFNFENKTKSTEYFVTPSCKKGKNKNKKWKKKMKIQQNKYLDENFYKNKSEVIITKIAVGSFHNLFLTNNGQLFGCGYNANGALGIGVNGPEIYEKKELMFINIVIYETTIFKDIFCFEEHTFLIDDKDQVWATGRNKKGELGLKSCNYEKFPKIIDFFVNLFKHKQEKILQIDCGEYHSVFLSNRSNVYGCGYNDIGQIGQPKDNVIILEPKKIEFDDKDIHQISSGNDHTLYLTNKGDVYVTGNNQNGAIGMGLKKCCYEPELLHFNFKIIHISAGNNHSLVLNEHFKIFGFGSNNDFQLNLKNKKNYIIPTEIIMNKNITQIKAGEFNSFFITEENDIYSIGYNNFGQLNCGKYISPIKNMQKLLISFKQEIHTKFTKYEDFFKRLDYFNEYLL